MLRQMLIGAAIVFGHGYAVQADEPVSVDFHGYSFGQPTPGAAVAVARNNAYEQLDAWQEAFGEWGYTVTSIEVHQDLLVHREADADGTTYRACWLLSVTFWVEGGPVPIPFPMPPVGPPLG